jgi:lysophospholipase L1-like esterase
MAAPTRDDGSPPPGGGARAARTAGRLLFAALLTALLLEVGARLALHLLGPAPAPIQLGWEVGRGPAAAVRDLLYVPDPELFFRLAPNLDVATTGNPRIFDLRTNSRGLRGPELSPRKSADTVRVLAVGDSCTFGSGAGQADTYPAQLQRVLAAALPDLRFEVVNAGVPGFTSYQALRYLELEGFALEPDVVVFSSAVNDASPATAGAKRRFGRGRLLTDREYRQALRAPQLGIARLLQRAGFLPGGVAAGSAPDGLKRRVPLAEYEEHLRRFAALSLAREIVPVVVAWPLLEQLEPTPPTEVGEAVQRYQQAAARAAAEADAGFVDLLGPLSGRGELFVDVVHLGPRGYRVVAERIAEALLPVLTAPESSSRGS